MVSQQNVTFEGILTFVPIAMYDRNTVCTEFQYEQYYPPNVYMCWPRHAKDMILFALHRNGKLIWFAWMSRGYVDTESIARWRFNGDLEHKRGQKGHSR